MIPEEAIDAAANAFSLEVQKIPLEQCDPYMREEYTEIATAALEAAMPHLEAALRTQIANDIRGMRLEADLLSATDLSRNHAFDQAARIAEKGNPK